MNEWKIEVKIVYSNGKNKHESIIPIGKTTVKDCFRIEKELKEFISNINLKLCSCDCGIDMGYFSHHGIQRKGMYCKKCHQLLDYIPQYIEDDF